MLLKQPRTSRETGAPEEHFLIHPGWGSLFETRKYRTKVAIAWLLGKHVPVGCQPVLFRRFVIINKGNPSAAGCLHSTVTRMCNILTRLDTVVQPIRVGALHGFDYWSRRFRHIVIDDHNL
jgi:hypothetical protein